MRPTSRLLATALLAATAVTARADFVTASQGVDFTVHVVDANTFTLEIKNAPSATGNWASDDFLRYFALKNIGNLSGLTGISVTSNAATPVQWSYNLGELTGQGCQGNGNSGSLCIIASTGVALTDDLLFTVDLLGSGINLETLTAPHLKMGFTKKQTDTKPGGDLLSAVMTAQAPAPAPAPATPPVPDLPPPVPPVSLDTPVNSVPEPATLALAGFALAGLALTRRRAR